LGDGPFVPVLNAGDHHVEAVQYENSEDQPPGKKPHHQGDGKAKRNTPTWSRRLCPSLSKAVRAI
jgi:hypothetical protein